MRRPIFIAQQAARPSGVLGRIIAAIMVRETEDDNLAAIGALSVKPSDHVLDVGCGAGRSLELLLRLVDQGSVTGIDPSPLMVERAVRRSCRGKNRDRLLIQVAAVEALPFEDETFDSVMSVHTIYFWRDLAAAIREIARVLRPGGQIALSFRTSANRESANFPASVYRFRDLKEVSSELVAAGFELTSEVAHAPSSMPVTLVARKSNPAGTAKARFNR